MGQQLTVREVRCDDCGHSFRTSGGGGVGHHTDSCLECGEGDSFTVSVVEIIGE